MPATPLTLHTPWPRALWQAVVAAAAGWWQRRRRDPIDADLSPLDERALRDMGLPDWLRHDLAERRQTRAVERIANGLPAEWSR